MTTTGELKRYSMDARMPPFAMVNPLTIMPSETGDWVKFADYDSLRSRLDAAEHERDTYKRAYNDSTESADECRKTLARRRAKEGKDGR